jgi:hypothetical protein
LGWTACRNVEIDVRLAARATAAVKNNSLGPERPHPQLKRDLLCDTPSRGNDGLPHPVMPNALASRWRWGSV